MKIWESVSYLYVLFWQLFCTCEIILKEIMFKIKQS